MKFNFNLGSFLLLPLLFSSIGLFSQSFSFNCTRDTVVAGCPANFCFTLKGRIPDIRKLTTSYTVNPSSSQAGCFPVYLNPEFVGTPSNLSTDDTYSQAINIGFNFFFYGQVYPNLKISSNGYVTFNTSRTGSSHFGILNSGGFLSATTGTPQDLPSALYNEAIIMGPYHDINIAVTTSPTRRITYTTIGAEPHRKWITSFYKVPHFSCTNLIQNTHQIVLYESTGIVEVVMFDRQICNSWNQGRAMIGMQNFDRTSGIMAPGRYASSTPWGSPSMNESWRFVPAGGESALKRVELLDNTGNVVQLGTTANLGNGILEVSFPNLCPPAGTTTAYVIRSVYEKLGDPTLEVFGTDTVNVNRSAGLAATATTNAASCGNSNGSVTIAAPSGGTPPYQYSINGGTSWQSSNVFSGLGVGAYTITVKDNSGLCTTDIPVNVVSAGNLAATTSTSATACTGVNNGSITISSAGGVGPHTFSLDGGTPVQGTIPYTFTNVPSGTHMVVVTDLATNCNSGAVSVDVAVGSGVAANTTAAATACPTIANGTITVNVTAGVGPFTYQIDGGAIQTGANSFIFSGLSAGMHSIVVTDNLGCQLPRQVTVPPGPSLTATLSQTPTSCSGASNGALIATPTSGTAPFQFSIDGGAFVTGTAPYTFTGLSAGNHSVVVKDALGCTSNATASVVVAGPAVTSTATTTATLCNGGNTGTLTVVQPSVGVAPFEYSIDGTNWQTSNTFNGLTAGTYTVRFRESAGCMGSTSVNVTEPTALSLSASTVPVICNAQTNGLINLTSSGGIAPYQFSIDAGITWQSANSFNVGAGTYTVKMKDANSCTTTTAVTVTEPAALTATAVTTNASCNGGNDGTITVTATGGNSTYSYSVNNGVNWQTTPNFSLAPGTYTVLVKDALNCVYTTLATVGLSNNLLLAPQSDVTICESKSTQLDVVSNGVQYDWSPATGLSAVNIPNPVASPISTTQYIVNVTLGRCSARDTVVVRVNAAPIPNAGPDIFICYGQSATLQGSGGTVYRWTPSTYLNSSSNPNAVSTPDNDITYVLSILSDANGCAALITDSVHIDVTPPMQVLAYPADTIGYPGDQFQLLAVPSDPDANNFIWTPSVGLSNAQIANPLVTIGPIGADVLYRVVASTVAGCKGEAYVNVRVYKGPDIYVPTGFTPNGDGKNDKFTPFPVGMKSYNYFRVFNRWGQAVFQTKKLNDGWDGTIGGQLQPDGIYVWMIEGLTKDDRIITKKGTVMLIK